MEEDIYVKVIKCRGIIVIDVDSVIVRRKEIRWVGLVVGDIFCYNFRRSIFFFV